MFLSKILSALTVRPDEQSNIKRMLARGTFYTASITLASVPVLQVFALSHGVSEASLGVVRLFVQAGGILGYLLFMRYANRIQPGLLAGKNFHSHLAIAVLPASMLVLSLLPGMPPGLFLPLFTAGWAVSGFFMARHLIIYARVESRLFVSPIYGRVFGGAGIAYYLLGMLLSAGVKATLTLTAGFFLIFAGALALALASFAASKGFLLVREEPKVEESGKPAAPRGLPRGKLVSIVVMHVFRGVMSGIAFFLVPVALKKFGLIPSDAGYVSLLFSAGYLVGYLFIFRRYDRIGPAKTTLLGAILQVLPFAILLFWPGRAGFFAFYFIFCIGDILICQGVPLGILQAVPPSYISTVTALRLVAFQATDALVSLGIGAAMIDYFAVFAGIYCVLTLMVALFARLTIAKPLESH